MDNLTNNEEIKNAIEKIVSEYGLLDNVNGQILNENLIKLFEAESNYIIEED